MSDVRAHNGVPVTAQFAGIQTPSACAPLVVNSATGTIYALATGDVVTPSGGGSGTVTSVAQTFTGGLISVAGSPIIASGTLALTVAGTSGGIPYFSGATTWASSAALAASALVIGGGAGAAPATTTTGTGVVTALGVNVGSAGAFVVNGGALGTPSSGVGTNITGLDSANFVGTNWTDLTDGGTTTLHTHTSGVASAITVANEATDTSCFPVFATAATGDLGPKSNASFTFNSNTASLGCTTFVGALTGDVTGNVSGTAATVTGAAQTAITSVGTLTALQVDNININGNEISSTAGTDLLITPLAGQQIVLDGTIVVDAGVVTGATSISSTTFVGALTGNASTATALETARTIGGTSFNGTANIVPATITIANEATDTSCFPLFATDATGDLGPKSNANLAFNSNTGALSVTSVSLTGDISLFSNASGLTLRSNTSDGSDTSVLQITGGGAIGTGRGAYLQLAGNDNVSEAGVAYLVSGDAGNVRIQSAVGVEITSPFLIVTEAVVPDANDGAVLGAAGTAWSDLFLAEGGVINWDSGDVTITQTGNVLAFAGAATGYTFDALMDLSGAAAGQIKFPATQNASANANTYDDYEEGTFTATLSDGTNDATMSDSDGRYVKNARACSIWMDVATSALGSVTGAIRINGLPFQQTAGITACFSAEGATGLAVTAGFSVSPIVTSAQIAVTLRLWDATTGTTAMQATEWTDDGSCSFTGTLFASA